ncbi:Cell division control protein [Lachnellula hyalina]|uniref:Cell division control protein n=1 Tax=Lachnellula hyalina TaxID=1316788 RepID=A0A8H8QVU8_9HELO|nr:Cell division control protein [Lachnellula hyalina]TVY23046.1 Cell division control protein [Lachnellula hyalina]
MVSTSRPRTPSASTGGTSPPDKLAPIQEAGKSHPPRRSSLGLLLRRTKSIEFKGNKKQQALREQELQRQREAAAVPKNPPRLPNLYNGAAAPKFDNFGGDENTRPDSVAIATGKAGQYGRRSMEPGRSSTATGSVPIPPIPNNSRNGDWVDPYARTESMTHRGRYSYASSAVSTINSPRRVRRRKDPTPFNILIIGSRSSGKTSFLNFLKTSLALPAKKRSARPTGSEDVFAPQSQKSGNFISHYLETEIDGERIGLTLWDSEGLQKNVVDLQLREMSSFLESKFEETFTEEMKVVRAPGVQDTHIHCAFLILDPVRIDQNIAASQASTLNGTGANGKYNSPRVIGGLDEDLDLQVLRTLQGKTTVVPVVSKADTITTAHMAFLKKTIWESMRKANLDPLEALGLDEVESEASPIESTRIEEGDEEASDKDSETEEKDTAEEVVPASPTPEPSSPGSKRMSSGSVRRHKRNDSGSSAPEVSSYLPLSIISPDIYEPGVIGRKFPWGFADPMNAEHCDFVRLKESVFSEWRGELREASRELWYEGWRTSRLKPRDAKPAPRR